MTKMVKIMNDLVEVGSSEWRAELNRRYELWIADKYACYFCEHANKLGFDPGTRKALVSCQFFECYVVPHNLTYQQYFQIGTCLYANKYGGTRFVSNGSFEEGWKHKYGATLLIRWLNNDVVLVWSRWVDKVKMFACNKNGDIVDIDKGVFNIFAEIENNL